MWSIICQVLAYNLRSGFVLSFVQIYFIGAVWQCQWRPYSWYYRINPLLQILQKLLEKLSGEQLQVPEVTQSEEGQRNKLRVVLGFANQVLGLQRSQQKWSVESVHTKNIVSILHLLVTYGHWIILAKPGFFKTILAWSTYGLIRGRWKLCLLGDSKSSSLVVLAIGSPIPTDIAGFSAVVSELKLVSLNSWPWSFSHEATYLSFRSALLATTAPPSACRRTWPSTSSSSRKRTASSFIELSRLVAACFFWLFLFFSAEKKPSSAALNLGRFEVAFYFETCFFVSSLLTMYQNLFTVESVQQGWALISDSDFSVIFRLIIY